MLTVAILLFEGVEVLDFAAPFEVFSLAAERFAPGALALQTVGPTPQVRARHGLQISPAAGLPTEPPDVLVLPGGPGVEPLLAHDARTRAWVHTTARQSTWVLSICSGALFLADAGLLKGRSAITHHSDWAALKALEPSVHVQEERRFVRDGNLVTSAGIAAGLDASLYMARLVLGEAVARKTATWMEYTADVWLHD
jgi:transcriptional regulator GlxA family with amidase domain